MSDTPRTDACPHCGAQFIEGFLTCDSDWTNTTFKQSSLCREREARQKAEAERDEARKDLIKNLQTTGGMLDRMLERDPYLPDYHLFRNEIIHEYGKLSKL